MWLCNKPARQKNLEKFRVLHPSLRKCPPPLDGDPINAKATDGWLLKEQQGTGGWGSSGAWKVGRPHAAASVTPTGHIGMSEFKVVE